MVWRVEIREKEGVNDCLGQNIAQEIVDLGLTSVKRVRTAAVYFLHGPLNGTDVDRICRELLADPVVQEYRYAAKPFDGAQGKPSHTVEIAYNPGVMDPVEASTVKAIRDLGIAGIRAVRTAKQYLFWGKPSKAQVAAITGRVLMNKLIQHAVVKPVDPFKDISSPVSYN
ncbi:MAG TPA: phosphoribosylformylglycinamidine synthase subunit PurS, partial [Candidatus Omnitrophota bacterium]|nr:phosphoribosylformylglycinamidine synthase subunit PurS [Candidatus Omnitrophota bacterium]